MTRWLSNWKRKGELNVEAELKAARPKPPAQLVKAIAARVNPRQSPAVRTRTRLGVAGVLTASLIAVLGASGGLGTAASGVVHFAGNSNSLSDNHPSAADQYAVKPTITSFSPANGKVGSTVTVTGTNFIGHSGITGVKLNGVAATSFNVTGSTTLTFVVPSTTSGPIVVTNDAGDSDASSNFIVLGTPTFDGTTPFTPSHAGSGSSLAIKGTHFTGVSKVTIGGKPATISGTPTETEVDVTVPAGVAKVSGAVAVAVTNPVATTTLPATDAHAFTYDFGGPTATTFSPLSGAVGDSVTVKGTNLGTVGTPATVKVYFGVADGSLTGVATVNNNTNPTQVTVTVPSGAETGAITLDNGIGSATTKASFTVIASPTITSFTPTSGKAGTTMVTVTGTSFVKGSTNVTFHGSATPVAATVKSGTSLSAKIPSDATSGTFTVSNGIGSAATSATILNVDAPVFDGAAPFAPTHAGTGLALAIKGTHFTGVTKVTIGGKPATISGTPTDTEVDVTVPAGVAKTTGAVEVDLTNGAGTTKLLSTDAHAFTYDSGAPTATTFSPASGAVGNSVTVKGTNLGTVASPANVKVYFGVDDGSLTGVATASGNTNPTQVTVNVPSGAETGAITLDNGIGSATTKASFTVVATPSVVSFSPGSGKAGTKVTLLGNHFDGVTEVDFGGQAATAKAVVKTVTGVPGVTQELDTVVPAAGATGVIKVTNAAGNADTGSDIFTVIVKPVIDASPFTPSSGIAGSSVTITGSGFTGASAVKFGAKSATFSVTDDNTISATVPTGATTGKVSVTNIAGTATSTAVYSVIVVPTVTSFTPTTGAVGATVTITGKGFTGATKVSFNGHDQTTVTPDSKTPDTKISVVVPSGATTGTITATTAAGTSTASKASFTVVPVPTIGATGLSATHGAAGSMLTITGTNLLGTTLVTFGGGTTAKPTGKPTATTVVVKVPVGAITGKITVHNAGVDSSASAQTFTVDYVQPTVSSFTPTSGAAGAVITIKGKGFTGVQDGGTVDIGGHTAVVDSVSDTVITAEVPSAAPVGSTAIAVTTPGTGGTGFKSGFTVLAAPTITGYSDTTHNKSTTAKHALPLVIDGTNLVAPIKVTFTLGGKTVTVAGTLNSGSSTEFKATAPASLTVGTWAVAVNVAGVTGVTSHPTGLTVTVN